MREERLPVMRHASCVMRQKQAIKDRGPSVSRLLSPVSSSPFAHPASRNSHVGFTLIEILAAVAIGAFLLLAAGGLLVETVRSSKRVTEEMELDREGWAILDLMAEDLKGLPAFAIDQSVERFLGTAEGDLARLDFVSSSDSVIAKSAEPSDLTEVGWRLKRREDGSDLLRLSRREDFFLDSRPLEGGTLTQLSDRVKALAIDYRSGDSAGAWQTSFSNLSSGKPPAAVRIRLTLARPLPEDPEKLEEKAFATTVLTGL